MQQLKVFLAAPLRFYPHFEPTLPTLWLCQSVHWLKQMSRLTLELDWTHCQNIQKQHPTFMVSSGTLPCGQVLAWFLQSTNNLPIWPMRQKDSPLKVKVKDLKAVFNDEQKWRHLALPTACCTTHFHHCHISPAIAPRRHIQTVNQKEKNQTHQSNSV
jgi:hypothetical protein